MKAFDKYRATFAEVEGLKHALTEANVPNLYWATACEEEMGDDAAAILVKMLERNDPMSPSPESIILRVNTQLHAPPSIASIAYTLVSCGYSVLYTTVERIVHGMGLTVCDILVIDYMAFPDTLGSLTPDDRLRTVDVLHDFLSNGGMVIGTGTGPDDEYGSMFHSLLLRYFTDRRITPGRVASRSK